MAPEPLSGGLIIVGHDKHGPNFSLNNVERVCREEISAGQFFLRRSKRMKSDIDKATDLINQAESQFSRALDALVKTEGELSAATKAVSGKVRDATHKLGLGLANIEKTANFDRLITYVGLLERAEKALSGLAELEASGKLEKITRAMK